MCKPTGDARALPLISSPPCGSSSGKSGRAVNNGRRWLLTDCAGVYHHPFCWPQWGQALLCAPTLTHRTTETQFQARDKLVFVRTHFVAVSYLSLTFVNKRSHLHIATAFRPLVIHTFEDERERERERQAETERD